MNRLKPIYANKIGTYDVSKAYKFGKTLDIQGIPIKMDRSLAF